MLSESRIGQNHKFKYKCKDSRHFSDISDGFRLTDHMNSYKLAYGYLKGTSA